MRGFLIGFATILVLVAVAIAPAAAWPWGPHPAPPVVTPAPTVAPPCACQGNACDLSAPAASGVITLEATAEVRRPLRQVGAAIAHARPVRAAARGIAILLPRSRR